MAHLNRKHGMRKIILVALFMAVCQPLFAVSAENEPLSLDEALQLAYINHPRMQEAKQDIFAAHGAWLQAEALPSPEAEINVGGLKKHGDEEKQVRKGKVDSFAISQPLDPLGTRFLRGRIARDEYNVSKGNLQIIWAEVRRDVITTYGTIITAEKSVQTATENLNATRQFFSKVQTRFQSGNALKSDVIRSGIEVSRSENELLIAQKDLKTAQGQMNLFLGFPIEEPLHLADMLEYEPLRYQYQEIKERALKDRVDLKNESTLLSARKKGFWAATLRAIFPQMSIGVERTTEEYENDTSLLLSASYPLWGFNFGEIKKANAEKKKQQIKLDTLKKNVSLDVYQSFLEAELTDKQVSLQQKALEGANELLRQITIQYEEGEVPFLAYLENIKTVKETRLAYFTALKNYKEKVADLERAIQATPIPEGVKQ